MAAQPQNVLPQDNKMICAYAVSGQYGLLSRLLFYALIVFATLCQHWFWPSMAAIAYIMNYSATAAFHAFVLLVTGNSRSIDLDICGTWAISSVASITVAPAILFSAKLRESAYRPLFVYWGLLVTLGAFCSYLNSIIRYGGKSGGEEPCYALDGNTLLTQPAQLLVPGSFNCSYACFEQNQPLRDDHDLQAIIISGILESLWNSGKLTLAFLITMVFGWFSGFYACLFGERKRTRRELRNYLKDNRLPSGDDIATIKSRRRARRGRQQAQVELETGESPMIYPWVAYLNIVAVFVVALLNELLLNFTVGMSMAEHPYAIGQWAPIVTIFLALVAAAINFHNEPIWKKLEVEFNEDRQTLIQEQQMDRADF